mmetsp:Transcript_27461/g.56728  ORF Transcript_27461/g.56728 Transcript_27461/m.56728 type:complete len:113 (-) Transcript_27461:98-436(-)
MAAIARSTVSLSAVKPRGLKPLAPRPTLRPVVTRFRPNEKQMDPDTTGAQHTGFHAGHADLHDDKLSTTVPGIYEWQLGYLFLAGTFLFLPFFPGFTSLAKVIYEGLGGQLL